MNKYIQQFLDDNDLEVNEEFLLPEINSVYHYFISDDGKLNFIHSGGNYTYNSAELACLLEGQIVLKKLPKRLWKPKIGERAYYINAFGGIDNFYYSAENRCDYLIEHNLIFKTKEDAMDFKWFLDMVDKYQKPFISDQDNYFIYFNTSTYDIDKANYITWFTHGIVYFGSKENCDAFIKTVGEERIKNYMFYLWK